MYFTTRCTTVTKFAKTYHTWPASVEGMVSRVVAVVEAAAVVVAAAVLY
jgi:hypothetical protein